MIASHLLQGLRRLVDVRDEELRLLGWSFFYFFCLLCSYYIIRPLRDTLGISSGVENLQSLYLLTIVVMLSLVPLFGWLTSRWPRRTFLPFIYGFFIFNLLVYWFLLVFFSEVSWVPLSFYLWVNIFNLFVVSVFWSFMADIFDEEQAGRLFGFIAAGGSAGAIAGPLLTTGLIGAIDARHLLVLSAVFLMLAIGCISRVSAARRAYAAQHGAATDTETANPLVVDQQEASEEAALGGGLWSGIALVLRSRYLLGICVLMLCYSVLSTFLYFQQVEIIAEAFVEADERTVMFARVDLLVNVLTIFCQLLVTGKLIRAIGLGPVLAIVPLLLAVGLLILGSAGQLGLSLLTVVITLQVVRRTGYYAVINPAREALYVVLSRAEKYKAKNFIDTSVYRAGDALSVSLLSLLRAAGFGLSAIAHCAVPLALLWAAVSLWLGREHRRIVDRRDSQAVQ